MRESVRRFQARRGEAYAPPRFLEALGRRLRPSEACPTLFRYPGPEGLRDLLAGTLARLAPGGLNFVWLSAGMRGAPARAVKLFGTLAVLEPLRWSPCVTGRRDEYVGVNRELDDAQAVVWVPPAALGAGLPWDRIVRADDAVRRFGRSYADARARVEDALRAYLEELGELRRAGAPGPAAPWCTLTATERRRILARHGVTPRWTGA